MSQKAHNTVEGGAANPGSDPHKGLKDNTPTHERLKVMRCVHGHRKDWTSCGSESGSEAVGDEVA